MLDKVFGAKGKMLGNGKIGAEFHGKSGVFLIVYREIGHIIGIVIRNAQGELDNP